MVFKKDDIPAGDICGEIGTYFYMKMECELGSDDVKHNRELGILVVFLGILMTLLY
jgi:hypothetical protein